MQQDGPAPQPHPALLFDALVLANLAAHSDDALLLTLSEVCGSWAQSTVELRDTARREYLAEVFSTFHRRFVISSGSKRTTRCSCLGIYNEYLRWAVPRRAVGARAARA